MNKNQDLLQRIRECDFNDVSKTSALWNDIYTLSDDARIIDENNFILAYSQNDIRNGKERAFGKESLAIVTGTTNLRDEYKSASGRLTADKVSMYAQHNIMDGGIIFSIFWNYMYQSDQSNEDLLRQIHGTRGKLGSIVLGTAMPAWAFDGNGFVGQLHKILVKGQKSGIEYTPGQVAEYERIQNDVIDLTHRCRGTYIGLYKQYFSETEQLLENALCLPDQELEQDATYAHQMDAYFRALPWIDDENSTTREDGRLVHTPLEEIDMEATFKEEIKMYDAHMNRSSKMLDTYSELLGIKPA